MAEAESENQNKSSLRWAGMGKYGFTPYRILNRLTFFKPMGPNQPQMGQTGYQSTPLYLCIQNIKLFFD